MSFIDPLVQSLERFVYRGICGLSALAPADRGSATGADSLATPLDGSTSGPRRR